MKSFLKTLLKSLLPKAGLQYLRSFRNTSKIYYLGKYTTWQEAQNACEGYNADNIIKKVRVAALKVKHGKAAFERDSMTFDIPEYDQPLVDALLRAASENNDALKVLDFGGSLGSLYFQHRELFKDLSEVVWCVVEQGNFVDCGKKEFEDNILKFRDTADEAMSEFHCNCLILSSVLPYIEKPYELINHLKQLPFQYIIIIRTPVFTDSNDDRLTVQNVPSTLYEASYPAWFFAENKLLSAFTPEFSFQQKLETLYHKVELDDSSAIAIGYILKKDV